MRLLINGQYKELACRAAFEVRELIGSPSDIIILNGFQLAEDCPVQPDDSVTIIPKGVMPDRDELESMMMARHTPGVHQKIKKGRVAIAGLGGLGSNIAVMLARIGVGELLLVDYDSVEPSNLNRQSYYISHLGQPKTTALQKQIEDINPFIRVKTRNTRVREENVRELFQGYDIICEAFDKPEAKAMLINTALVQLPGVRIVAASGMAGFDSSNLIKTSRPMKNLYLCGDLQSGAEIGRGLMAPRVQICAGHQANMVLRLLLDLEEV